MKTKTYLLLALWLPLMVYASKPETFDLLSSGEGRSGTALVLKFEKGKQHNHPLFAVWLADSTGRFIETLYVSHSIGKGVFPRADRNKGAWQAGEIQRPAALPYWAHQRNILNEFGTYNPTPRHPETDAVSGATPSRSFIMNLLTSKPLDSRFKIFVELNQSWDWNEAWYNDRFPGNKEYMTSSQPALVYQADADLHTGTKLFTFKPVGRSSHDGSDGKLYPDLNTLTTALQIAKSITLQVR